MAASADEGTKGSREADESALVFLDIDGVLATLRLSQEMGDPLALSRPGCQLVNEIVRRTGARVVVSSTWRRDADCRTRLLEAGLDDVFAADWRTTPFLDEASMRNPLKKRGSEIAEYLGRHPCARYVILDDDDMLGDQRPRHVRTDTSKGIYPHHVEAACDVLAGRMPQVATRRRRRTGAGAAPAAGRGL